MGIFNLVRNLWQYSSLDEEIKSFKSKGDDVIPDKTLRDIAGEGHEFVGGGPSAIGLSSFNLFYNNYINKAFKSEVDKIGNYRVMAQMPEISDVIEDIVIESSQEDLEGKIIKIEVIDEDLRKNENIVKNIEKEFENLFYNKIKLAAHISDLFRTYYIDGRLFYERLINRAKPEDGIIGIKKLPTETMDFEYDPKTLKITRVFQYLKDSAKRPEPKETEKEGVVIFHPEQIGFIDYGIYGKNRYDILGYLDKSKIPYNQLKLLETSVIIYRIVRAPERLVFKIDVGNMPKEKAIKYVEEQKSRMVKKPTYDPQSGALTNAPEIFCIKHDTKIPLLDGRSLSLDDIIGEFKSGKDNWVYSLNRKTHKIEPGKIVNASITRKEEPLVRVWLDNGEYLDTTYDHKYILRNGEDCRADELAVNDSLMPLYKKYTKIRSNVNKHYEMIMHPKNNRYEYTHIVVSDYTKIAVNHKVVRIEYLEEKADCGCLTIDDNSNFACNCGVFINNSVQDNIFIPVSCLTLHTEVLTMSGTKTLQRLIKEYESGMTNHAIVFDKSNRNGALSSKIKWAGVTRKNTELVRVFLDNNDAIDLTPDHKFILDDGSEVEAQHLESGTVLASHIGVIKVVKVLNLAYKEDTGCLEVEHDAHNFLLTCGIFVRNSEGGRGSDVTTVGGNPAGFAELADINYFQRKLYKALKYPMSRVNAQEQHQDAGIVFSNSPAGEISRDEIKWATFLMRHQMRFCDEMQKLFLLHLEFKGLKKQYSLDSSKINVTLNPPSFFKDKQEQLIREMRFANYLALANQMEFSKSYLMERYLDLSEEEIQANADGLKKDIKYGFKEAPMEVGGPTESQAALPEPEVPEDDTAFFHHAAKTAFKDEEDDKKEKEKKKKVKKPVK